jgi:hypothetical protein
MRVRRILYLLVLMAAGLALNTHSTAGAASVAKSARFTAKPFQTGIAGQFPRTLDDKMVEVARRVPAFGGLFIGPNKKLHIYLLDPAQRDAAGAAIKEVFGDEHLPEGVTHVHQGQYGFLQLKQWHDRHRTTTLAIPGVLQTSIHKSRNRMRIGVKHGGVIAQVEQELARLGVPREAVEIVEMEPQEFFQTLQNTTRPLLGGLQISPDFGGACTLGFLAVRQGEAGFVTCQHCTSVRGAVDGTVFHQAFQSGVANRIGVETADPPLFTSLSPFSPCPLGRQCRYSDSAFIKRDSGPDQATPLSEAEFSHIAATDYNSLAIVHKFRITSEALFPIEGQSLSKVGRTTGLTEGEVSDTCVDVNSYANGQDTGITFLCQDQVEAKSKPGDSGSPVFSWSSASLPPGAFPRAKLYGILRGGDGSVFTFSNITYIQAELGQLKTYLEEPGANSPPEVKIRKPSSGVTVGLGGFGAQFQAEVVDYEGCCDEVKWVSNKDGVIGQSTSITHAFSTPGTRTITFTVTDSGGATASDSIVVNVNNSAPTVAIIKPTPNQTVFKGALVDLEGQSSDMNEPLFTLPCSKLKWTSSKAAAPFPVIGCQPKVTFATTGSRTITLTGTDSQGGTGTDSVTINVVNPPPNDAPWVSILFPTNNAFLDPYKTLTLKGTAADPDNGRPLTYKWVLRFNNKTVTLGTGTMSNSQQISLQWKPSDHVPFDCGGDSALIYLYVTDPSGKTGLDYMDIYIGYPTC